MTPLHLMTIVGTRPEIIRLSAVIRCCDRYFRQTLVHTGQNWDYTLHGIFFFRTWACGHRTGSSMWPAPTWGRPWGTSSPSPTSFFRSSGRTRSCFWETPTPASQPSLPSGCNSHLSHGGRNRCF